MEHDVSKLYGEIRLSRIYHCKDGRKRIDVIGKDWRKTFQVAKLLLEIKLGRILVGNETVDHIDGDKSNDSPDNLRVLSLSENASDSVIRINSQVFNCPMCSIDFTLTGRKMSDAIHNRKKGKAGPFCGRSCAGKYGTRIQYENIDKLDISYINRTYYNNKEFGDVA